MGVDDVCDYLEEKGFHSDIVTSFHRNRMSGATFLELSEDDLKDLVPVIGDRVTVRSGLLVELREVQCRIASYFTEIERAWPSGFSTVLGCPLKLLYANRTSTGGNHNQGQGQHAHWRF